MMTQHISSNDIIVGWATFRSSYGLQACTADVNPDFHDWNHVYIPYCSGDLFLGMDEDVSERAWGLRFSGYHVRDSMWSITFPRKTNTLLLYILYLCPFPPARDGCLGQSLLQVILSSVHRRFIRRVCWCYRRSGLG